MKLVFISVISVFVLWERFNPASCSIGDRSSIYLNCNHRCVKENCTNDGEKFRTKAAQKQDIWCKLLRWSCDDECRYQCMWFTVQNFKRAGEGTPKFHGRWPFIRVMGMQEPASAFSSILNFAANAYMYKKIQRQFPLSKARAMPIVAFWHGFAMVCMNAWVWSTIFHMRDNPFTEFMDYACALSMVMGLFVAAVVRLCYKRTKLTIFILLVPLFYFVTHVRYLYEGVINYDYNMSLNIFFGVAGSLIWVGVTWRQWRLGHGYAWRMLCFTLLSGAALSLELFDFPPRLGAWDAHALWHLSTSPLPLLFYRYVLDDLHYLQSKELEKFAFKLT
ncbi:post-GPI attachment to proteins factor 3 [Trichoplusia ni]|uniref:Post-GPI attachment to proteins factor 3 n=1 Tax=Trichoplusia ni TaxID=7111 RepID=A0A7E5WP68_TRINI|nr:post-GPI attachment to proteins factor 3 [Trichoplusia ni]